MSKGASVRRSTYACQIDWFYCHVTCFCVCKNNTLWEKKIVFLKCITYVLGIHQIFKNPFHCVTFIQFRVKNVRWKMKVHKGVNDEDNKSAWNVIVWWWKISFVNSCLLWIKHSMIRSVLPTQYFTLFMWCLLWVTNFPLLVCMNARDIMLSTSSSSLWNVVLWKT